MLKRLFFLALVFSVTLAANAQLNPVTWSFTATKVSDKTYEIHMKATMQTTWHLYSQTQPADAIAIPTTFTINANPLFTKEGKIKEVGKMELPGCIRQPVFQHSGFCAEDQIKGECEN
jgi:hypothetical protein